MRLIYADLARNVEPRILNTDAAMLEVLPDVNMRTSTAEPFRVVVLAHVFYPEMTTEIVELADRLPGAYDLVVTTPDHERAEGIRLALDGRVARGSTEVRVLASNDGRDQSAFLIGCRDILLDDSYDIVVKLHSKKTPQDSANVGTHFKRQQFTNLLDSAGYASNVLGLFQDEPGLGIVYPPTIHLGYPSLGHGWWANKPGFVALAQTLGIRVPVDEISPLAPFGSMFIARPEALRLLMEHEWSYDDFAGAGAYRDGGLAHILERMPSYAAGELGYHTRTIANAHYLASSYAALDFNFDQMSSTLPDTTMQQIQLLQSLGPLDYGTLADFLRMYTRKNRPHDMAKTERAIAALEKVRGVVRRMKRPFVRLRAR